MASQLKDSLVEAIEIMQNEDSKITYDCTVIKCLDGVTGKYELDYMSDKIIAYTLNGSRKYLAGDLVMVIAPKGDFNDVKYILGLVNPRAPEGGGEGGGEPEKEENTFLPLTDDLFDLDNPEKDIFGLKSYYSNNYNEREDYYEENITTRICDITKFKERIPKYLSGKEITYLRLKADFKTALPQEQIYSNGIYGIKLYIPFVNKGYVKYEFNSNDMEGNPKAFINWTSQTFDIKISQGLTYNDALPPIVKIYKDKFVIDEMKVKEPDIEIKGVELYALSMLTPEELKGYRVFISATGGEYFIKSDSINNTKVLTASLKSNGVDTDTSEDEIYWFIEDPTIDEDDPEFFDISGKGWKCLNPYTIEKVPGEEETEINKTIFAPRLENIEVIAKEIKDNRKFKCLIKHNGNFFSGEITIYNETDTFFLKLIPTDGEIISLYEDEVELKLKFYYKGLTDNIDNSKKICYTWSKIEKDGSEDFYFTRKYLRIIDKNKIVVEDNKIYWETTVTFPTSIVNELATIKCAVDLTGSVPGLTEFEEDKKHFIGIAEIKLQMSGEEVDPYLEDIRKAIPKVLYSYNTNTLKVQQDGVVITSVACKLLRKSDLQGHLVVNLISSEYCNAVVRFLDNEMTELFAPVTFTLQPGRNTIGVPHDYLYRLAGIHSFIITMQCTNGIVTIPTRGVLFTLSGGYLIERLMDIGMDIQDISVKQSIGIEFDDEWIPYEPEELWTIGIDNGNILAKSCKYILDDVLEWTPRYSMGKGLAAAIEFDGVWTLRDKEEKHTLITEKEPYVFIIELDGTLVVYKGGDLTTRRVLDTNVTQLSVVRGFKSEEYKDQDQGLICAYIKNGHPFYTRYVYMEISKNYNWETPIQMSEEETFNIYVQRLNDYRVGFLLEFKDRNMWYISTRTYVAQAVPPEYLDIYTEEITPCLACVELKDADSFNGTVIVPEKNTEPTDLFQLKFNWPLVYRRKKINLDNFDVKVNGQKVEVREIKIDNNILSIYTKDKHDHQRYDDTKVVLTIKDFNLQLRYKSANYHEIDLKEYTFIIVRPINNIIGNFEEDFNITNLKAKAPIIITPVEIKKGDFSESFEVKSLNPKVKLDIIKIKEKDFSFKENFKVNSIDAIVSLETILVGTSPI